MQLELIFANTIGGERRGLTPRVQLADEGGLFRNAYCNPNIGRVGNLYHEALGTSTPHMKACIGG